MNKRLQNHLNLTISIYKAASLDCFYLTRSEQYEVIEELCGPFVVFAVVDDDRGLTKPRGVEVRLKTWKNELM